MPKMHYFSNKLVKWCSQICFFKLIMTKSNFKNQLSF